MPITTFTVAGSEVEPLLNTFEIRETVGGVSTLSCDVISVGSPTVRFAVHDEVVVQEDGQTIFAGIVMQARERGLGGHPNLYTASGVSPEIVTTLTAEDYSRLAERIHVTEVVVDGTLLKTFLTTLVSTYLGPEFGVTLHASQVNGPALPAMTFDLARASDVLKALADATQFAWRIDYDKTLRMWAQGEVQAPFDITETDDPARWTDDVEVENILGDDYANRIIVISGAIEQQGRIESFTGDDVTDTFTLQFTLTKAFGIIHIYESDGVTPAGGETFAIVGTDTFTQWEYYPDTNTITRVIGPTEAGKIYRLTFDGTFEARAEAEDAGEIAANGLYEDVVRAEQITDNDAALALAQSLLAERLNAGEQRVSYHTRFTAPTFHVGQEQDITAPARGLIGSFIVTDMRIRAEVPVTAEFAAAGLGLIRSVTAKLNHALTGRWQDTYRDWLRLGDGGAGVEVGDGGPGQAGPAPPDKSVQFNRNGVFGGDAAFLYYEDRNSVICGGGGTSIDATDYESVQAHGYNTHIADGSGSPSSGTNVQLFPCQSFISATSNVTRPWHILAGRSTSSSQTMDMPVAVAGTFRNLAMELLAAPGSGASRTFTLYKNGSATALAVTISGTSETGVNTSDEVTFAVGDRISLRNAATGTPALSNWKSSLEFEPDDGTTLLYGYAQVFENAPSTHYSPPFWGSANADTTAVEADQVCEIGAACTVTHWEHRRNAAPGTGVTCTLHLMKNGVAQDGTGGTVDTTLVISGAVDVSDSASFSLALAQGDTLSIRNVVTGGTSAGTFSAGTFAVTPDTTGEVQYHATHISAVGSGYVSPVTATGGLTASFNTVASIGGPTTLTLGGMWARLGAAPDTGNGWTITLTVDGVDTDITVTIEDAETEEGITGQSVSIPSGSTWGLHVEVIGNPTADGSNEMWIVLLGATTTSPVLGSVVWGTNTTVAATLATAMGLDGLVHVHDTPNTFIVYGDQIITGDLTIEGNTTITGTISLDLDALSNVTLASPVLDGEVLTYDSGTGQWTNEAPTGGGALDDLSDVALGSPLSDGEVLTYDSGTGLWTNAAPTGGGSPAGGGFSFLPDFTAPVNGDFSWVNQESATVTETVGGIVLAGPAGAGEDLRCRVKSAPSTPYVITAAFLTDALQLQFQGVGLCWRDSSGGGIVGASFGFNNAASHGGFSGTAFRVYKWNSPTSFSAVYASSAVSPCFPGPVLWLRIADDSTNRTCALSVDGVTFTTFHTVGRTDFITADQVGFFVNAANATWGISMTLLSWEET